MKIHELIKASESLLNTFDKANVSVSDAKYIPLYCDYSKLKSEGRKTIYIIAYLSDIYNLSERTVYTVVKKFEKEV